MRITSLWLALALTIPLVAAHGLGGDPDTGGPYVAPPPTEDVPVPRPENPCDNEKRAWREATVIEGVAVEESLLCTPDDPRLVAAFVKGTNHMPTDLLDEVGLHEDAVIKGDDLDGDGDPDEIHITLEVIELNGWHLSEDVLSETFDIAPGIAPGFWVFAPKTTIHHSGAFREIARMPTPPIRVEAGDTVRVTLENTHYFPHTIHFHGVDHRFLDEAGEGNDGVPHVSEAPVLPGEKRTYEFTPRVAGSMFFHCHVQPQVHVAMGLGALFVIEQPRANNSVQTFNPGAGHVRHPSVASREAYDREYDLLYQNIDKELNAVIQKTNDPRIIARAMNREYDAAEADPDHFLLNGRSFPYTLRESTIVVAPDEAVLLRVANVGSHPVSLHTHGHKPEAVALDGVPLDHPERRDTHWVGAAQRTAMRLTTTDDGLNAYGPGVWLTHDHQEEGVTTDGINPGGDITAIVYESFLDEKTAMPIAQGGPWTPFFNAAYYRGEIPVWQHLGLDFLGQRAEPNATATTSTTSIAPPAGGALIATVTVLGLALGTAAVARRWRP